eukprot:TRINITY_DN37593_c0_g1_i1.p1 TRINITY_DN37593_c0_g1~~TRINITY_DN37593_c0_g1_i1.p1  ORF type:complete len:335 (+),score=93.00 TRINITY_DN37593_c0_g1_i1:133-1137(+)
MIRRPPRSTLSSSSAASDVYKRQYQRRVRGSHTRMDSSDQEEFEEFEEVEECLDDQPMQLAPRVFLGSVDAARNHHALSQFSILRSLRCCNLHDLEQAGGDEPPPLQEFLGLEWWDRSDQDILEQLPLALEFLRSADQSSSTLVWCIAGRSRSAAVVLAWLMLGRGYTVDVALEAAMAVRPWIDPNPGFIGQLRRLEFEFGTQVAELASAGPGLLPCWLRFLPRVDFHPTFVDSIREGTKKATSRVVGDHNTDTASDLEQLQEGWLCVAVVNGDQGFQVLRVSKIEHRKFCEVDDELAKIENLTKGAELQEVLTRFYPKVCGQDDMLVIHFESL